MFRFSAYPALVLGTFFGPTVCSFLFGCQALILCLHGEIRVSLTTGVTPFPSRPQHVYMFFKRNDIQRSETRLPAFAVTAFVLQRLELLSLPVHIRLRMLHSRNRAQVPVLTWS